VKPGSTFPPAARCGRAERRAFASETPLIAGRKLTPRISSGAACLRHLGEARRSFRSPEHRSVILAGCDHRYNDRRHPRPFARRTIAFACQFRHLDSLYALRARVRARPGDHRGGVLVDDTSKIAQTESDTLAWLAALKKGRVEYQTFDRKSFSKAVDGIFAGVTLVVGLIGAVSLVSRDRHPQHHAGQRRRATARSACARRSAPPASRFCCSSSLKRWRSRRSAARSDSCSAS